ncbi:MAG: DUF3047 domain-containing protein [Candidatus Omnitrophica bacterium]|nr:DUF3047 domain-containing protein [Candidatus Omnitrophota bacterium]
MCAQKNKRLTIYVVITVFAIFLVFISIRFDLASHIFPEKKVDVIKYFPFSSDDSLKEWDKKILHKRVDYSIETKDDESYVRAMSRRSCSALYHKMNLDVKGRPFISWKWRVGDFPDKRLPEDLLNQEEDDFAARVYVIFPAIFFSNTKVLEYVWARDLEAGEISSSPYSDNIKLMVVESGPSAEDKWVTEERNIYVDYLLAFKSKPKAKIGAIAFMCDSDSTGSSAEAFFDDIKVFYKEQK